MSENCLLIATATKRTVVEESKVVIYAPDTGFTPFVAKLQKAKTRKGKDYFVLRTTIPKEVTEKINVNVGDYLFFKAKKAEWYHMMDWSSMQNTWKMLPDDIKKKVLTDGLFTQGILNEVTCLDATNVSASMLPMINRMEQNGEMQWK